MPAGAGIKLNVFALSPGGPTFEGRLSGLARTPILYAFTRIGAALFIASSEIKSRG